MKEEVIRESEHGRTVLYRESDEERAERKRKAYREAEEGMRVSPGQAEFLKRALRSRPRRAR